MASQSRKGRYVAADTTWIYMEDAIKAYDKNYLKTFGYYYELNKTEEECFRIFREERRKNQLLNRACEKAELFLHTSDVYEVAKCAYTLEDPPLYSAFNNQTRNLLTFFDWAKFEFKGLWLLLHKAWLGQGSTPQMHVYRGVSVPFQAKVGSVVKFKQFASTSASKDVTLGFIGSLQQSTLFDIKIKVGLSLADCSMFPDEKEFIIPPHDGLEVVDVKMDGRGMTTIVLEQKQQSLLF